MLTQLRYAPLALAMAASIAQAQVPTRTDYCNADPLSRRVADATALVIPRGYLKLNTRGDAYELTTRAFDYNVGVSGVICPNQPYYEQIRAIQGRTGFLIGEQTFMTAPHAASTIFDPTDLAILFDWRWIEDGPQTELSPDRNCKLPIDPDNIPLNAVYHMDTRVPAYNTKDIPDNPADYMIFQLDRPVTGVTPLPLRRSGQPLLGDPLIVPGFPNTLPLKIVGGGSVQRVGPAGLGIGDAWIDHGSSGSPVFNTRAELVESVVAVGALPFVWQLDSTGTCLEANFNTVRLGHRSNLLTNTSIMDLPDNVLPATTSLQVAPLNLVTHIVNAPDLTNRTTTFDVTLPASAPAAVDFMVKATYMGAAVNGSVPPEISIQPDAALHTIQPGTTRQFTANITATPDFCELVDAEIRVTPQLPGAYASVIPHRFEVDWRDFDVTPDSNWVFFGFAPPYPTRQLTISNPSRDAQNFTVNVSTNWLRVNNAASVQLSVPAGGTATATLSIVSTADLDVPPGTTGHARVTVTPDALQCVARGAEEIDVAFTNGVVELTALNTADIVPSPTGGATYGTAQEYSFDLSAYTGETIADVDVLATFITTNYTVTDTPSKIKIELQTPDSGATHMLTLWDGQTAPPGYFSAVFPTRPLYRQRFHLNDETTPPLAGTPLSDVDGEDMGGIWKVRLYNRTQQHVMPEEVTIRVGRTP